ncbi:hypothetical protein [Halioxenophilus sp. WMMB6]|uniref:hypothetical protein n=1 Tax=Halioxenophilus sp. WMMB6 TaxID=3073815 RepID=UPI00295E6F4E|nr:hypothetical protein [Halioxenophilus sp. WMMB6]
MDELHKIMELEARVKKQETEIDRLATLADNYRAQTTNLESKIDKLKHILTFLIWLAGAVCLFEAWEWQKGIRGTPGETIALILMVIAWCYAFALWPISIWVSTRIDKM